jgi:hypothetical protein
MLYRHRHDRNPYFHFHPMHSVFSLVTALILLGLLAFFMTQTAR